MTIGSERPATPQHSAPPRSALALAGAVLVLFGVWLTFRPFTSLTILIVATSVALLATGVITALQRGRGVWRWPAAAVWILAGLAALLWPELTTEGIAIVTGVALVIGGVADLVTGIARPGDIGRGRAEQRAIEIIWGLASIILGALALMWPDVTVLVVAIVVGVRTAVFGARLVLDSLHHTDHRAAPWRRHARLVGVVVMLLGAVALAVLSGTLLNTTSSLDAFYDPPAELPDEPGELLRAERFDTAIPDGATAWRVLYTTTRSEGLPAVASGLVVVPDRGSGPFPVIAWAHGTTGVDVNCAPSAMKQPFESGAFFALDEVIDNGWALVATDYVGLGADDPHPYLVGDTAARSVLDAIRAARQLADSDLTEGGDAARLSDDTVVWGHSQGGGAALWTGLLASTYAPDVQLSGVAAAAPASDLSGLVDHLPTVEVGSIFAAYVLQGFAAGYPDVEINDYVLPAGRTVVAEATGRCLDGTTLASAVDAAAFGFDVFIDDIGGGALGERLDQNVPRGSIDAPLLVAQGEADQLIVPSVQAKYVSSLCDAGQQVDYRTYPGLDHVPLVQADSPLLPELVTWTAERFDGAEPTPTCN